MMKKLVLLSLLLSARSYSQYPFTSPYLQHPEKAIGYVDSCAQFWKKAYDSYSGGFYMNINRDGSVKSSNAKNSLNQSRDAYGFVRAFQLTGNEEYLTYARHALDFMYASAWDNTYGGWITRIGVNGKPTNPMDDKTAYYQHYALLGITAYFEATRDTLDWAWLMKSYAYNEAKLWDARPATFGYYDNVKANGTNPSAKSFNATVDAVTTHLLHLYLMTGDSTYKSRLLQLCDNMINRLYESSKPMKMGFAELYDANWNVDNSSTDANRTIMGHVLKTSWCLARVYEFNRDTAYLGTAKRLTELVWQKGYDHQNGGPYKDYDRNTGVMMMYGNPDTCKAWWQMEQAVTDGLMLYHLTGNPQYAQMADESVSFFMNYFVDHIYGDVYADRTKYGKIAWNEDKGSDGKAGYHSIETGYYVYLYGNLLVKKAPATLYYYFIPDVKDKQYAMNPISTTDPNFTIASVTYNGADYPLVDKKNRIITVPANSGGKFAVTYSMTGATNVASPALTVPGGYALKQNYPNPFNPSTQITFTLPAQTSVTLGVYDMLGREIAQLANGTLAAGEHSVTWNASGIPSGVYVYRIRAGVFTETKKLILQR
jgi:mannose/cellobiose epimerase-like protein (N-acyl-D-glucosamine 2-epimerase family)